MSEQLTESHYKHRIDCLTAQQLGVKIQLLRLLEEQFKKPTIEVYIDERNDRPRLKIVCHTDEDWKQFLLTNGIGRPY